jgi:hypothetical protein
MQPHEPELTQQADEIPGPAAKPEPESEPAPELEPKLTPEEIESWALGCSAILASHSLGYKPSEFGMFEKNDSNAESAKSVLSGSWGINNREDLIGTITRMTENGHNESFIEYYSMFSALSNEEFGMMVDEYLAEAGEDADIDSIYMTSLTKLIGDSWGDKQIKAWDWFRMIHLAGWGYIAGYFEREEAYEHMIPVIERLNSTFSSWEEAVINYMGGYAWWSQTNIYQFVNDYRQRWGTYEGIKDNKI